MTTKALNVEEYRAAVGAVHTAMMVLSQWDLVDLEAQMQRGLDLGPFVDPTLWRDKHKALEHDRALVRAALPLYRAALKLQAGEPLT